MKHFSRFNCARSRQEHWGLCSEHGVLGGTGSVKVQTALCFQPAQRKTSEEKEMANQSEELPHRWHPQE